MMAVTSRTLWRQVQIRRGRITGYILSQDSPIKIPLKVLLRVEIGIGKPRLGYTIQIKKDVP